MRWDAERSDVRQWQWLAGGGTTGESISSADWGASPLGPIGQWPPSLLTALGICLAFPGPCCVVWGEQRTQLYNDRYSQLPEIRPGAMGGDFADSWRNAWPAIRPWFDQALGGESALIENQRVLRDRDGVREQEVLSFSFIPVRDGAGCVRAVLISIVDPTATCLLQDLERARHDVDAYSYSISHDFRAPLRTMEGMARIMVDDYSPQLPADVLRLLHHIMRGATKLADRADALASITRLTRQPLSWHRIDVTALVHAVVVELRKASPERRIEVIVGDLPAAEGDPELLRLVFASILSNAFKFTRNTEHARIEVGSRPQPPDNVYCVKDNGVGFDMKQAGRLYGFFQRLHSEAQFDGIGAGLALARRLIERHGGTIWAEAQKDRGATFHLTLPVCRACGET